MPSLRSRALLPVMLAMRTWQTRLARQGPEAIAGFAARADRMAPRPRIPSGVDKERAVVGGVAGDWFLPRGATGGPTLLFIHGGGMFFGLTAAHREVCGRLALLTGMPTFAIDYRLLRQHPYPAAHDDCDAVLAALGAKGAVVLVGESSGGVLSLAAMLRARAANRPLPRLWIGISPTADYGFDSDPTFLHSRDPFASAPFTALMHRVYVGRADLTTADLSPVAADLTGLSPMAVHYAEHDLLRTHAERLASAARRSGVPIELREWPGMWHGWHLTGGAIPEARAALDEIAARVRA